MTEFSKKKLLAFNVEHALFLKYGKEKKDIFKYGSKIIYSISFYFIKRSKSINL